MNIRPWSKMPTQWIVDGRIRMFTWKDDGAAGTAALILFVTLCHLAVERAALPKIRARGEPVVPRSRVGQIFATYAPHLMPAQHPELVQAVTAAGGLDEVEELPEVTVDYIAHASYDELGQLTGLSRKLIAAGLRLLIERLMIERVGSPRGGDYRITDLGIGFRWAKLPGQVLLSAAKTRFEPLTRFELRSRYALAAMKLYCYYASARSHTMAYSQPSYAKSFERTGVSERDIPRGNSLLISVGLLAMYHRPSFVEAEEISLDDDLEGYGSNRYYMAGYQSLFAKGKGGRPAANQHGT